MGFFNYCYDYFWIISNNTKQVPLCWNMTFFKVSCELEKTSRGHLVQSPAQSLSRVLGFTSLINCGMRSGGGSCVQSVTCEPQLGHHWLGNKSSTFVL